MNDASIRKDLIKLYGKRWMDRYKPSLNNDIREVRSRIAKMSGGNKTGIPFGPNYFCLIENRNNNPSVPLQ